MSFSQSFRVVSPSLVETATTLQAEHVFRGNHVEKTTEGPVIRPSEMRVSFRTRKTVPRMGLMMIGLGGNNGTTTTAQILANRENIHWRTKEGEMVCPFGSFVVSTWISRFFPLCKFLACRFLRVVDPGVLLVSRFLWRGGGLRSLQVARAHGRSA